MSDFRRPEVRLRRGFPTLNHVLTSDKTPTNLLQSRQHPISIQYVIVLDGKIGLLRVTERKVLYYRTGVTTLVCLLSFVQIPRQSPWTPPDRIKLTFTVFGGGLDRTRLSL